MPDDSTPILRGCEQKGQVAAVRPRSGTYVYVWRSSERGVLQVRGIGLRFERLLEAAIVALLVQEAVGLEDRLRVRPPALGLEVLDVALPVRRARATEGAGRDVDGEPRVPRDDDRRELAEIALRSKMALERGVLVVPDRPRVLGGLRRRDRESEVLAVLVAGPLPPKIPVQSAADRDATVRRVPFQQDGLVVRRDGLLVDRLLLDPREEPDDVPGPDEDGLPVAIEGRLRDRPAGLEPDVRAELRALVEPSGGHAIPPPREEPSDLTHPATLLPDEPTHLGPFPRGCERTPEVRSRVSCRPTTRECSLSSRARRTWGPEAKNVLV